ncbi:hypothetical protein ACFXKG_13820 [Streptomyces sp. NPDC059255]|uniref:hypothetical protein n=1 Tax=Streptomyces sp. NPDC059255 TaxID=3346793 RepID=UPI0036D1B60C
MSENGTAASNRRSLSDLASLTPVELQQFLDQVKDTSEGQVLGTMDSLTTTIMTSIE